MLNAVPLEVCLYLMARTTRPSTKKFFSLYFTQLRGVKLHVTGDDLIKLGIPPGRIYTKILDGLLKRHLTEKLRAAMKSFGLSKKILIQCRKIGKPPQNQHATQSNCALKNFCTVPLV